jgi:hypothetical protein
MKYTITTRPTHRLRNGRALVECLVSIFLLAITSLSVAATTRSTLALADDSALVTDAQAMVTTRVEDALTFPCATSGSGVDQLPRMNLQWQQSGAAQNAQLQIDLTLDRSPIAVGAGAPIQSVLAAGGVCP